MRSRLAALSLLLVTARLCAFDNSRPIDITSDRLIYLDDNQQLEAYGHVVIHQASSTLTADTVIYERKKDMLHAFGNAILTENNSVMSGDRILYNLAAQTGEVIQPVGKSEPWIFEADRWNKFSNDVYRTRRSYYTTCNLEEPHFHFKSQHVRLIPKDYFVAWNTLGYLGTTPIFYTPFMRKTLKEQKVVYNVRPGTEADRGAFLKNSVTVRTSPHTYNRLLIDYYSRQAWSWGNEFNYDVPDKVRGSLLGLYAKQGQPVKKKEYNVRSYHWQRFNQEWIAQSNVNIQSVTTFNKSFNKEDYNPTVSDLTSTAALTRQSRRTSTRLSAEMLSGTDNAASTDLQTQTFTPSLEFQSYSAPLWKKSVVNTSTSTPKTFWDKLSDPVLYTTNSALRYRYRRFNADGSRNNDFRPEWDGGLNLSKSMPVTRKLSLSPSLGYSQHWQDSSAFGGEQGFKGSYSASLNARYRLTRDIDMDATHGFSQGLTRDSLIRPDDASAFKGVQTHQTTLQAYARPSRNLMIRSYDSFLWPSQGMTSGVPGRLDQRLTPWVTEMTYNVDKVRRVSYRQNIAFAPLLMQSWQARYEVHRKRDLIYDTGVSANNVEKDRLALDNRFRFWITPNWLIDVTSYYNVGTKQYRSVRDLVFTDSQLRLTRDLHCWVAEMVYRQRGNSDKSIYFNMQLKTSFSRERKIRDENLESEFYPWRADERY